MAVSCVARVNSRTSALQMARNGVRSSTLMSRAKSPSVLHHAWAWGLLRVGKLGSPHVQILARNNRFSTSSRLLITTSYPALSDNTPSPHTEDVHSWKQPPDDALDKRPVLVIGAGNLGRRIATVWASSDRDVTLYDRSEAALRSATEFITDELGEYCTRRETHPGHVRTTTDLEAAVAAGGRDADDAMAKTTTAPWMVIECLPENLATKTEALAVIERLLPTDCILASNSSGLRTADMASGLAHAERLLNTHYYLPPGNRSVELMSSGRTDAAVFPFLAAQMRRVGLAPIVVPPGVQSHGFIFNRVWAATKRETLAVLAEGVARPAELDALFRDFFHAAKGPCERMDEVGLDIVAGVEAGYLARRPELAVSRHQAPLDWLRRTYVDKGDLGEKTGDGLYSAAERAVLKERRRMERRKLVAEANGE